MFLTAALVAAALVQNPAPAAAQTPNLTDPEVAHVAVTADNIDIDLAKFAETKTHSAPVRAFAQRMITDHTGVNEQAAALAKKLGVTPTDNAVSQSLLADAKQARAKLESLEGAAFDRAYLDREIAYHQAVLDAIDKVLIPTTDNAELKKLLTDVRPAIVSHLDHAKRVRGMLGGGDRASK